MLDDGRSPAGGSGAENDRRATDGGYWQGAGATAGGVLLDTGRGADEGGAQRRQVSGHVGRSSWRRDVHHCGLDAGRVGQLR
jgi:hypothetical protein